MSTTKKTKIQEINDAVSFLLSSNPEAVSEEMIFPLFSALAFGAAGGEAGTSVEERSLDPEISYALGKAIVGSVGKAGKGEKVRGLAWILLAALGGHGPACRDLMREIDRRDDELEVVVAEKEAWIEFCAKKRKEYDQRISWRPAEGKMAWIVLTPDDLGDIRRRAMIDPSLEKSDKFMAVPVKIRGGYAELPNGKGHRILISGHAEGIARKIANKDLIFWSREHMGKNFIDLIGDDAGTELCQGQIVGFIDNEVRRLEGKRFSGIGDYGMKGQPKLEPQQDDCPDDLFLSIWAVEVVSHVHGIVDQDRLFSGFFGVLAESRRAEETETKTAEPESRPDGEENNEGSANEGAGENGKASEKTGMWIVVAQGNAIKKSVYDDIFGSDYTGIFGPVELMAAPDPDTICTNLLAEFPWMGPLIDRIGDDMVMCRAGARPRFKIRPVVLVGPPAIGKTRFARRLAEMTGIPFSRISGSGMSDNRMLQGTARAWRDSSPALPVKIIEANKVANPLILMDEVEKAGGSTRAGWIHDTLLTFTENESSRNFLDEYLEVHVDLSHVNWIMTSNDRSLLPPTLRSRLGFVEIDRPSSKHFPVIFKGILTDVLKEYELPLSLAVELDDEVYDVTADAFRKGAELRTIKAVLTRVVSQLVKARFRMN